MKRLLDLIYTGVRQVVWSCQGIGKIASHLIVPVNAINTTSMAMAHNVPLEDAQESHVVVVIIIIVAAAIIVVGGGSVTGTEV